VRHCLSVSVLADPELTPHTMALARRLAEEGGPFETCLAVAEATIEVWRVRRTRAPGDRRCLGASQLLGGQGAAEKVLRC
jgi:hypothetical protein